MSLRVLRAPAGANLQDRGRYGHQHLGIPPGGAMDQHALEKGQAILGNAADAAVIELSYPAPQLLVEQACFLVITGADLGATLEWTTGSQTQFLPLPPDRPAFVPAGCVLRFTQKKAGNYAYLSVQGGFNLDEWLGSYSTNLMARAGGFEGRFLQKGDRLFFMEKSRAESRVQEGSQPACLPWWASNLRPDPAGLFSFVPGPDWQRLAEDTWKSLTTQKFCISPDSNRMGFRLSGPALSLLPAADRWSAAVVRGSLQCLPNGQLIVLMADHQTTGGYPVLGVLTPNSVDFLAQWPMGKPFGFQSMSPEKAEAEHLATATKLHQLKIACTFPMHENHRLQR